MIKAIVGRSSKRMLQSSSIRRVGVSYIPKRNTIATIRKSTSVAAPIVGSYNNNNGSNSNDYSQMMWMKTIAGSVAATGAALLAIDNDIKTDCCGIVGVVGTKENDAR